MIAIWRSNMKNTVGVVALAILSLAIGYFFGVNSNKPEKDKINCGYDEEFVVDTYNEWINKALVKADKRAEKHPVKVLSVEGALEYNSIPEFMKNKMYEDFKDSKLCRAHLLVNYTPDSENETNEEIEVRYQKIMFSSGENGEYGLRIESAGIDMEQMAEQAVGFYKKHNGTTKK